MCGALCVNARGLALSASLAHASESKQLIACWCFRAILSARRGRVDADFVTQRRARSAVPSLLAEARRCSDSEPAACARAFLVEGVDTAALDKRRGSLRAVFAVHAL